MKSLGSACKGDRRVRGLQLVLLFLGKLLNTVPGQHDTAWIMRRICGAWREGLGDRQLAASRCCSHPMLNFIPISGAFLSISSGVLAVEPECSAHEAHIEKEEELKFIHYTRRPQPGAPHRSQPESKNLSSVALQRLYLSHPHRHCFCCTNALKGGLPNRRREHDALSWWQSSRNVFI